jgi:hypothetical protein
MQGSRNLRLEHRVRAAAPSAALPSPTMSEPLRSRRRTAAVRRAEPVAVRAMCAAAPGGRP